MDLIINPTDPTSGGGNSSYIEQMENGSRGPLRHFLIGTPQRVRATIRHLHARRYVDSREWGDLTHINPAGLVIRPTLREVYTYLQLPEHRD